MSTDLAFQEAGVIETRQERALRRAQLLHNAFQTAFEVLAEIYRDEDWRYINDGAGRPYTGFTAFVQDQLGCAASNARRYQQGIVGLILPLQELTAPGTRIPVTSSDVARLGVTGARVVIEQAPAVLEGLTDPDAQTDALRDLIDTVTQRSTAPGFGPLHESSTPPASPLGALVPAEIPDDVDVDAPPFDITTGGGQESTSSAPPWGDDENTPTSPDDTSPAVGATAAAAPATPAGDPVKNTRTSDEDTSPSSGAAAQVLLDLEAAITAVLAAGEPTTLAEQLSDGRGAHLAPKCLATGQRLVRLGQLLRSLS
ncbi:hypothetical protein LIX17_25945 (plasmid) [Mycobacterium avium subsp. hominissuis]|uniref:hypothetical protein n=1 Tax=Mycobacterium avium TaxID=1764 RepID=UPI00314041FD